MATAKKVAAKKATSAKVTAKAAVKKLSPVQTKKPTAKKVIDKPSAQAKRIPGSKVAVPAKKMLNAASVKVAAKKVPLAAAKKSTVVVPSKKAPAKSVTAKGLPLKKASSAVAKSGTSTKTVLNPQAAWPFPTGTKP